MPISKNSRATAQLAPLNHFSPQIVGQGLTNGGIENNGGGGFSTSLDGRMHISKAQIADMPSLE